MFYLREDTAKQFKCTFADIFLLIYYHASSPVNKSCKMEIKYIFTVMYHKLLKTFQTTLPHGTIIMMEFGEQFLLLIQKNISNYIHKTER